MVKQTVIIIAILFSLNANAQTKSDSTAKQVDNNTPLLSIADLNRVDSVLAKKINKFELVDYNQVVQILQSLVNYRIQEWNKVNAIKPKK